MCHHATFGHPEQYTELNAPFKANETICKVPVRRVHSGNVFFEECGCDGTGEEQPEQPTVVVAPMPVCVLCDEFATIAGTWCGEEHRRLTLEAASALVAPNAVNPIEPAPIMEQDEKEAE